MSTTATLSLETLSKLSPELTDGFKRHVQAAVVDCRSRPNCKAARRITITLDISPSDLDLEDVTVDADVGSDLPKFREPIAAVRARRSKSDQLQFDFEPEGE